MEHKAALIASVGEAAGEEVISEQDLRQLLNDKPRPVAYNGFERFPEITITRPGKSGGDATFKSYTELAAFAAEELICR